MHIFRFFSRIRYVDDIFSHILWKLKLEPERKHIITEILPPALGGKVANFRREKNGSGNFFWNNASIHFKFPGVVEWVTACNLNLKNPYSTHLGVLGRVILGELSTNFVNLPNNDSPQDSKCVEYAFFRFRLQAVAHSTTPGSLKWIEAVFQKKKFSHLKLATFLPKGGKISIMICFLSGSSFIFHKICVKISSTYRTTEKTKNMHFPHFRTFLGAILPYFTPIFEPPDFPSFLTHNCP